jgi:hypothetical protein
MGDKSPKSTRKSANQKQTKADADQKKKTDAEAARQTSTTKTPPGK